MKKKIIARRLFLVIFSLILFLPVKGYSWGFWSHRKINYMAVFLLPEDMIGLYKKHIDYLSEHAIDPDKRSHGVEGEAEKHYFDAEKYGDHPFDSVPRSWKAAVKKYSEDSLRAYGINPWWIEKMMFRMIEAFKSENLDQVLSVSANFGHYIADATVPLHTSMFYDGKILVQRGIHAFWETRVPELLAGNYDFFIGRAVYIEKPLDFAWELVEESHAEVDTVFAVEEYMRLNYPEDKKYVYAERGATIQKQLSEEYTLEFCRRMNNMVERKFRRAIYAVASMWFTAWVNAGQPDLKRLEDKEITAALKKEEEDTERMWRTGKPKGRQNPIESEE